MHKNSLLLFETYARQYIRPFDRVLEIGPDATPSSYQKSCGREGDGTWITLDLPESGRDPNVIAKGEYDFPLPSNSYDIVLSGQVIEHVRKPWLWVKEIARICRPNGVVITIAPCSWPYHEAPVDCWRIYREGMEALYEEANIDVVFATTECLEIDDATKASPCEVIYGLGYDHVPFHKYVGTRLIEASLDTIAIGVKRQV